MTDDKNPEDHKPSENEIADYYDNVKKLEMQGHESGIRRARSALFATAGVLLLGEIISVSRAGVGWTPLAIFIVALEVGAFIALGFWTKSKPFTAIVVGLILFLLLWVMAIIVIGLKGAVSGLLIKIVILAFLISALKPAKAWEDLKKKR